MRSGGNSWKVILLLGLSVIAVTAVILGWMSTGSETREMIPSRSATHDDVSAPQGPAIASASSPEVREAIAVFSQEAQTGDAALSTPSKSANVKPKKEEDLFLLRNYLETCLSLGLNPNGLVESLAGVMDGCSLDAKLVEANQRRPGVLNYPLRGLPDGVHGELWYHGARGRLKAFELRLTLDLPEGVFVEGLPRVTGAAILPLKVTDEWELESLTLLTQLQVDFEKCVEQGIPYPDKGDEILYGAGFWEEKNGETRYRLLRGREFPNPNPLLGGGVFSPKNKEWILGEIKRLARMAGKD